ncbi:MAG: DUF1501 domain-containing protein [Phycisphaerales bacterium]
MCDYENAYTRRVFLQKGLSMISAASTVPFFVQQSAFGMTNPLDVLLTSSIAGVPEDRVLVVVQLGGGNDGLNTVVPFGDDTYYRRRPNLGIRPNEVLKLKEVDGLGFHPNLGGLKELYDDGLLTTVQGVGYPNPNRSHFTSMDIWHTADPKNPTGDGWIGRYFDNTCAGAPDPNSGIAIGREVPTAMVGEQYKPVSFESPDLFRWIGQDVHEALAAPYDKLNRAGTPEGVSDESQLGFLTRTSLDAQVASDRIRQAVRQTPLVNYPGNSLAQQLRMVGAMIRAGLPTRVYYVHLGGFDTHAGQAGQHGNLMNQLSSSLRAFQRDLEAQGNDGRVLTMTFSEFGRRVAQNASQGTDHGTAAPMFLMGPMVKAGFVGSHPSLTDLDNGDLKFRIDFRSVYASVLDYWLKADSEKVLNGKFKPAPVLSEKVVKSA